jgi:hypothetical protein
LILRPAAHFHAADGNEIEDQQQYDRHCEKREQVEHSLSPFRSIADGSPQRPDKKARKANREFKVRKKTEYHRAPKDNDPNPRPSFFELL